MRRLYIPILIATAVSPQAALSRDAEMVLRGSLVDSLVDFREEKTDAPRSPSIGPERGPATTNPARPRRQSATDDLTQGPRAAPSNDVDDDSDGDGVEKSFEFAIRGGHDSNYDEIKGGKGSGFVEVTSSGSVSKEIGDTTLYASADATYLHLPNLKGFEHRPDATAQAAIRRKIGDDLAIQAGVETGVDATDDPITSSTTASLGAELLRPSGSFAVRASYDNERALSSPGKFSNFREYDYDRPTVEASALLLPGARVSPIASIGVSRITFPTRLEDDTDEDDNPIRQPDRDAVQVTGALGLRASLTDKLVVKVSARANRRDFDEKGLKTRTTFGPDVEATWSINDDTTLEASFQRTLTESETYGSLAEDISAFAIALDYAPDKGFGVKLAGEFEHSRELGIKDVSNDVSLEMIATYRTSTKTFFEVGLLRSWSIDKTGPFDSRRFKITAGGGYSF